MNVELERLNVDLAVRAQGLVVADQVSADKATELVLAGKEIIRKIKTFFGPLKDSAWAAHKALVEKERGELAKVEPIVTKVSDAITAWRTAEERKRREAEEAARRAEEEKRKLEAEALRKVKEAEEKAEQDRLRLEREAEELQRKEREARETEDKATLAKIEERREQIHQEAQAVLAKVEEATDKAIQEAAEKEATMAPAPKVPEAPRTVGLSMRTYWKAQVVDLHALLRAVVDGQISAEAVSPNMSYLNDLAGKLKDSVKLPGVRFYFELIMANIGKRNGKGPN